MCFVNGNDSKSLCFNLKSCCFGQDCSHFPFWTAFSLALCRGTSFCLQRATPRKIIEGIHFLPSCPSPPTFDLACSLTACHFGCIGALLIELFISGYGCLSLDKSSCQTNTLWFAGLLASWSGSLTREARGTLVQLQSLQKCVIFQSLWGENWLTGPLGFWSSPNFKNKCQVGEQYRNLCLIQVISIITLWCFQLPVMVVLWSWNWRKNARLGCASWGSLKCPCDPHHL